MHSSLPLLTIYFLVLLLKHIIYLLLFIIWVLWVRLEIDVYVFMFCLFLSIIHGFYRHTGKYRLTTVTRWRYKKKILFSPLQVGGNIPLSRSKCTMQESCLNILWSGLCGEVSRPVHGRLFVHPSGHSPPRQRFCHHINDCSVSAALTPTVATEQVRKTHSRQFEILIGQVKVSIRHSSFLLTLFSPSWQLWKRAQKKQNKSKAIWLRVARGSLCLDCLDYVLIELAEIWSNIRLGSKCFLNSYFRVVIPFQATLSEGEMNPVVVIGV